MWDKQMFSKSSEMLKKEQEQHKAQLIQKKSRGTIMLFF